MSRNQRLACANHACYFLQHADADYFGGFCCYRCYEECEKGQTDHGKRCLREPAPAGAERAAALRPKAARSAILARPPSAQALQPARTSIIKVVRLDLENRVCYAVLCNDIKLDAFQNATRFMYEVVGCGNGAEEVRRTELHESTCYEDWQEDILPALRNAFPEQLYSLAEVLRGVKQGTSAVGVGSRCEGRKRASNLALALHVHFECGSRTSYLDILKQVCIQDVQCKARIQSRDEPIAVRENPANHHQEDNHYQEDSEEDYHEGDDLASEEEEVETRAHSSDQDDDSGTSEPSVASKEVPMLKPTPKARAHCAASDEARTMSERSASSKDVPRLVPKPKSKAQQSIPECAAEQDTMEPDLTELLRKHNLTCQEVIHIGIVGKLSSVADLAHGAFSRKSASIWAEEMGLSCRVVKSRFVQAWIAADTKVKSGEQHSSIERPLSVPLPSVPPPQRALPSTTTSMPPPQLALTFPMQAADIASSSTVLQPRPPSGPPPAHLFVPPKPEMEPEVVEIDDDAELIGEAMQELEMGAFERIRVPVRAVRYTQGEISPQLRNGDRLEQVVVSMVQGDPGYNPDTASWLELEAIKRQGKIYSNDNRRLHCLKRYQDLVGHDVYVRLRLHKWPPAFDRFLQHYDSMNDGSFVKVRKCAHARRR